VVSIICPACLWVYVWLPDRTVSKVEGPGEECNLDKGDGRAGVRRDPGLVDVDVGVVVVVVLDPVIPGPFVMIGPGVVLTIPVVAEGPPPLLC